MILAFEHSYDTSDRIGIKGQAVELCERMCPINRLSDAGLLKKIEFPQLLYKSDNLLRQGLWCSWRFDLENIQFAFRIGVVDPVVEAPAFKCVVNFTRSVRRNNNNRRFFRGYCADFRDCNLKV